ncbi:uncharacterized protein LOC130692315 [Daphnia carinata]|uniref:uncharacterized protein LOC130692315 n=1 Tax=Daphnia carinata TaxID=120202 RepID=UPI002579D4A4|nr:uncharacterized protein LOC130692315 [Daphnia carinata]
MTNQVFIVTMFLLALAARAMSASLLHQSSIEDDNEIDHMELAKAGDKITMLEMTKALLLEQVARATSTSEVLTLNITNLVVLLVIKAIIFGFGFLGSFGRRSSPPSFAEFLIDRNDVMMVMSYALGSATEDYNCLYQTACDEPESAQRYMSAIKMLVKGAKMFKNDISFKPDFEDVIYGVEEAIEFRKSGGLCRKQYVCKPME